MQQLMLAFPPRRPSDLHWASLNRNPLYQGVERNDNEQAETLGHSGLPINHISAALHGAVLLPVAENNPSAVRLLLTHRAIVYVRYRVPELQALLSKNVTLRTGRTLLIPN